MKQISKAGSINVDVLLVFLVTFMQMIALSDVQAVTDANEVTVTADKAAAYGPFLPDVQGTKINKGKKTSRTVLNELPQNSNNNYRQALVKEPGLLLSEETTPLVSLGYRGLDPHRGQFTQFLKDGVPIHADMLGYPEAYYTPVLQSVDTIEFLRGGAALMYGPQPGGALNYVTKMPRLDTELSLYTENIFGSDQFFSTYEAASGTVGPMGYLAYFHERQGDGFRHSNSDFEVISSGIKSVINQTGDSRLTMTYDEYHEEHVDPGGLSLTSTANPTYEQDRNFTTREHDRFRLERYYGTLDYEKEFSDVTQFDFKVFGGHYRRYSKRQRTSGNAFGNLPSGANAGTNSIEEQDFYTLGMEPRVRRDYELVDETHTLSAGFLTYMSHSPREDQRGTTPQADTGALRKQSDRDTWYMSVFLENLFRWGKLSVTPGIRLEHVWQRIVESVNLDRGATAPLTDANEFDFVPLYGLGIVYEIAKQIEAYINISESYRPKIYTQAVPTGSGESILGDLKEGYAWQYDFGIRGNPVPFVSWDVDYFLMDFKDQIGSINSVIQNSGHARHHGIELATEVDIVGAYDFLNGSTLAESIGSISPFVTLTLLDAEFYSGPSSGRQPQYAPQYNVRYGVNYSAWERLKASVSGTFVDEHFADDGGTANRYIPAYQVWDLTAEILVLRELLEHINISLFGGINNLFDEEYYARIRSDGIDPAYGRNYYGGFKADFAV